MRHQLPLTLAAWPGPRCRDRHDDRRGYQLVKRLVLEAPGMRLASKPFMTTVAVRSLVYLVIFLTAIAIGQILLPNHLPASPVSISGDDVLFCFGATFVVSFLFEVTAF
jgi:hypothetical protein